MASLCNWIAFLSFRADRRGVLRRIVKNGFEQGVVRMMRHIEPAGFLCGKSLSTPTSPFASRRPCCLAASQRPNRRLKEHLTPVRDEVGESRDEPVDVENS